MQIEDKKILIYLLDNGKISKKETLNLIGYGEIKTKEILNELIEKNLIARVGQGRAEAHIINFQRANGVCFEIIF